MFPSWVGAHGLWLPVVAVVGGCVYVCGKCECEDSTYQFPEA